MPKIHICRRSRRRVAGTPGGDGADDERDRRRTRRPAAGGDAGEKDDPKYVSLRVPKSEYDKLKRLRAKMEDKPDYSWVGSLALGAFVGLAAGLALKRLAESGDGDGG